VASQDKLTFSGLTTDQYDSMIMANNIVSSKGVIVSANNDILLQGINVPDSFHEQLHILLRRNDRSVRFYTRLY
jgi:hypothetical protein